MLAFVKSGKDSEYEKARATLTSAEPQMAVRPDVNGFEMHILCDTNAEKFFDGTADGELSKRVKLRNEHLEAESGATVAVSVAEGFYNAAKNDILSGAYKYDLYAAKASGNLSRLLAEGELYDLSNSNYIDFDKEYYDTKTVDDLAIRGGKYLMSSAAADARLFSEVIVYEGSFDGSTDIQAEAEAGVFTFDNMFLCGGCVFEREDIYPLWFGLGESFVSYTNDEMEFISHKTFADTVEMLSPLASTEERVDVFEIQTLYDVMDSETHTVLPLPKAMEEAEYGGYVNLSRAVMTAMPRGTSTASETEYLFDRMAYLSAEYISPYFADKFKDESDIYNIVIESAACDLSVLLGYGDIGGLIADCMQDDAKLTLEYYNRKALYEKVLSIIAKRLDK